MNNNKQNKENKVKKVVEEVVRFPPVRDYYERLSKKNDNSYSCGG